MFTVEGGDSLVEGGHLATVVPGKGHEIGIGYLPVPYDPDQIRSLIWDRVRPESVPRLSAIAIQNCHRVGDGEALTYQEAKKRAFGDRAGGDVRGFHLKPSNGEVVVNVLDHSQGDDHIAIGEKGGH